jgi:hypothetical protein
MGRPPLTASVGKESAKVVGGKPQRLSIHVTQASKPRRAPLPRESWGTELEPERLEDSTQELTQGEEQRDHH